MNGRVMDSNVGDVMHRGVVLCLASAFAGKIAKIMLDNNVSALRCSECLRKLMGLNEVE